MEAWIFAVLLTSYPVEKKSQPPGTHNLFSQWTGRHLPLRKTRTAIIAIIALHLPGARAPPGPDEATPRVELLLFSYAGATAVAGPRLSLEAETIDESRAPASPASSLFAGGISCSIAGRASFAGDKAESACYNLTSSGRVGCGASLKITRAEVSDELLSTSKRRRAVFHWRKASRNYGKETTSQDVGRDLRYLCIVVTGTYPCSRYH